MSSAPPPFRQQCTRPSVVKWFYSKQLFWPICSSLLTKFVENSLGVAPMSEGIEPPQPSFSNSSIGWTARLSAQISHLTSPHRTWSYQRRWVRCDATTPQFSVTSTNQSKVGHRAVSCDCSQPRRTGSLPFNEMKWGELLWGEMRWSEMSHVNIPSKVRCDLQLNYIGPTAVTVSSNVNQLRVGSEYSWNTHIHTVV